MPSFRKFVGDVEYSTLPLKTAGREGVSAASLKTAGESPLSAAAVRAAASKWGNDAHTSNGAGTSGKSGASEIATNGEGGSAPSTAAAAGSSASAAAAASGSAGNNQWACPRCTLLNDQSQHLCGACSHPNQSPLGNSKGGAGGSTGGSHASNAVNVNILMSGEEAVDVVGASDDAETQTAEAGDESREANGGTKKTSEGNADSADSQKAAAGDATAPKRKRGRPRKHPLPEDGAPKRKRGRPRKHPLPEEDGALRVQKPAAAPAGRVRGMTPALQAYVDGRAQRDARSEAADKVQVEANKAKAGETEIIDLEDDSDDDDGDDTHNDSDSESTVPPKKKNGTSAPASKPAEPDAAVKGRGNAMVLPTEHSMALLAQIKALAAQWQKEPAYQSFNLTDTHVKMIAYSAPTSTNELFGCGLTAVQIRWFGSVLVGHVLRFLREGKLLEQCVAKKSAGEMEKDVSERQKVASDEAPSKPADGILPEKYAKELRESIESVLARCRISPEEAPLGEAHIEAIASRAPTTGRELLDCGVDMQQIRRFGHLIIERVLTFIKANGLERYKADLNGESGITEHATTVPALPEATGKNQSNQAGSTSAQLGTSAATTSAAEMSVDAEATFASMSEDHRAQMISLLWSRSRDPDSNDGEAISNLMQDVLNRQGAILGVVREEKPALHSQLWNTFNACRGAPGKRLCASTLVNVWAVVKEVESLRNEQGTGPMGRFINAMRRYDGLAGKALREKQANCSNRVGNAGPTATIDSMAATLASAKAAAAARTTVAQPASQLGHAPATSTFNNQSHRAGSTGAARSTTQPAPANRTVHPTTVANKTLERWSEYRIDAAATVEDLESIRGRLLSLLGRVDARLKEKRLRDALTEIGGAGSEKLEELTTQELIDRLSAEVDKPVEGGGPDNEASGSRDNAVERRLPTTCPLCFEKIASPSSCGTCDICEDKNLCDQCYSSCPCCRRSTCADCLVGCDGCSSRYHCSDCMAYGGGKCVGCRPQKRVANYALIPNGTLHRGKAANQTKKRQNNRALSSFMQQYYPPPNMFAPALGIYPQPAYNAPSQLHSQPPRNQVAATDPARPAQRYSIHRFVISEAGTMGINITTQSKTNKCVISRVHADSIALKHGIRVGDEILPPNFLGGEESKEFYIYNLFLEAAKRRPIMFEVKRLFEPARLAGCPLGNTHTLHRFIISESGPIGLVMANPNKGVGSPTRVRAVKPSSLAEVYGIWENDVICIPGTEGRVTSNVYDWFLEKAKSGDRPLVIEVLRQVPADAVPMSAAARSSQMVQKRADACNPFLFSFPKNVAAEDGKAAASNGRALKPSANGQGKASGPIILLDDSDSDGGGDTSDNNETEEDQSVDDDTEEDQDVDNDTEEDQDVDNEMEEDRDRPWLCDHCSREFDTFEKATTHEETCQERNASTAVEEKKTD